MGARFKIILSITAALTLFTQPAQAQSLTIQGKVMDGSGNPITGNATQFRVQILAPDAPRCVLFDETHTVDMSTTNGLFSLNLANGSGTANLPTTYTLEQAVSNISSFAVNSTYCASGAGTVTYTPDDDDNRKVVIQFRDPGTMTGWETIPEMDLNPMAYAMQARAVSGFPASSLLRVVGGGVPGTAPALTAAEATELQALVGGTSTKYMARSASNGAQLPSYPGNPSTPNTGSVWFDSTSGNMKYYDGTTVQTLGTSSASGDITGVTAGTGLTGGGLTGGVTLALDTSGVSAGSYGSGSAVPVLTVDAYGRITAATTTAVTGGLPSGSSGQFLKYTSSWGGASINLADLKSTIGGAMLFSSPGCTAAQSLYWDSGTDQIKCQNIAVDAAAITSGTIAAARLPAGASMWQDAGSSDIYYSAGRVAIGTNAPTAALSMSVPEVSGAREHLFSYRMAGAPAVKGGIVNGTSADGVFMPTYYAYRPGNFDRTVTSFRGMTDAAGDVAGNENALVDLAGLVTDNATDPMNGNQTNPTNRNIMSVSSWNGPLIVVGPTGNLGVGTIAPSAAVELKPGTTSTAPLRFNAGTNRTTPQDGAMEYNGSTYYLTVGSTRYAIPLAGGAASYATVSAGAGAAATPSLTFSGDTNTGFYSSAADTIGVSANGAKVFDFSSAGLVSPTPGGAAVSSANGTASSPTFSFAGDSDTGWFRAAADTLAAATGGTERVRIDSSGNIGVGTTNPQGKIHVVPTLAGGTGLVLDKYDNNEGGEVVFNDNTNSWANDINFGDFRFNMMGGNFGGFVSTPLIIKNDGKVGIGTVQPSAGLHVKQGLYNASTHPFNMVLEDSAASAAGVGGGFAFAGHDGTFSDRWFSGVHGGKENGTGGNYAGFLAFHTRTHGAGSIDERMRISSTGSVGIGTTSPESALSVGSGSSSINLGIAGTCGIPGLTFGSLAGGCATVPEIMNSSGSLIFNVPTGSSFDFRINNVSTPAALTISSAGNVGISSIAPTEKLDVVGNARVQGQIYSKSQTITGGTNSFDFNNGNSILTDYDCGSTLNFANLRDGGTYTLVITGTGTTTCNFNTTVTGGDAGTVNYRFKPANGVRSSSSYTVYTLMRVGNTVLVSWSSGF